MTLDFPLIESLQPIISPYVGPSSLTFISSSALGALFVRQLLGLNGLEAAIGLNGLELADPKKEGGGQDPKGY